MRTQVLRPALRFTSWLEQYLPDAFLFALLATVLSLLLGSLWARAEWGPMLDGWGKGFFSLLGFTLQMALIIILGHVVASADAVARLLGWLGGLCRTARGAVAQVALLAMLSSWLNWGFSLVFSAMLARAVARRFAERGQKVDYRALAAASFLGLGSIWAQGLSGSAALQMATPGALPPGLHGHGIPLSQTIFLWQSLLSVVIEVLVVTLLMWLIAPSEATAVTAADLGCSLDPPTSTNPPASEPPLPLRPGERPEHSPWLSAAFVLLALGFLWRSLRQAPSVLEAVNLNTINLFLLALGTALHRTPARLQRAFAAATPAVWGVILQFPFYGGIAGILASSGLNARIADLFVGAASQATLPPLVAAYSALLGVLVPSGGSKWLIEAPYVLAAAERLHVHAGWMVAVYDLGEALANLIQPFWMLPVLGLLGLKARDVMRYTILVFFVLTPLVLASTYALGLTLRP
ncbi:MAG: short-chain fatty acid transporter [Myxococcales bacterium]|nr:short-chain fatty acid transporter [Myxococcales bacterium]